MSMVFRLTGLSCADCAAKFERGVAAIPGITKAELNFGAAKLVVEGHVNHALIAREAAKEGIGIHLDGQGGGEERGTFWQTHRGTVLTSIAAVALAVGWIGGASGLPYRTTVGFYAVAILAGGYFTLRRGLAALIRLDPNMNALMTIAVAGAAAIGQWWEGATVAFLYSVSNNLESYSTDKARASIRSLVNLAPKEATVRRADRELRLPIQDIEVGDVLLVKPGERIAMDGKVVNGRSTVDQSPITGESIPVEKTAGEEVYAGTINRHGFLEIQVTKLAEDTTLARIIHLVEEAQAQRAPSHSFVDRFAKYYTPAVLATAAGLMLIPPLWFGQPWTPWIYRALALVVVACPCALVVSTPVAIVTAIGNAARHGVLIKGGIHLEEAGAISAVAFDKTGTLTVGRPSVTGVKAIGDMSEEDLLRIAAAIERKSEHPLAKAIGKRAAEQALDPDGARGFESLAGKGARAEVGGKIHYIGNPRLFEDLGVSLDAARREITRLQAEGKTAILLGTQEEVLGVISVADELRAGARKAIAALKQVGIDRIVMLTGDNEGTARAIAQDLGVQDYSAGLLPQDKVAVVKDLLAEHGRVAMVGDGINDAPALAVATVGIAMGAAGSDAALETADIALMSDDLTRIPFVIGLSRAALRTIKQNIALALVIKGMAILAVFPGWLTLWLAILGDMGATLLVTANALRLLRYRPSHSHQNQGC